MKLENKSELRLDEPIIKGHLDGNHLTITIVVAAYDTKISQGLLDGCIKGLNQCNVMNRKVIKTEGSFELPLIAQKAISSSSAVICLGSVIKGDTAHFEYVCEQTAAGIQRVMLDSGKPVLFGVLTTYNYAQALERCLPDENNKGLEVAITAVKMCTLLNALN